MILCCHSLLTALCDRVATPRLFLFSQVRHEESRRRWAEVERVLAEMRKELPEAVSFDTWPVLLLLFPTQHAHGYKGPLLASSSWYLWLSLSCQAMLMPEA